MTETTSDPLQFFQISKDLLTAQQKFFPSGKFFERFSEVARNAAQAQIAYGQAIMRANAALLGVFLDPRKSRRQINRTKRGQAWRRGSRSTRLSDGSSRAGLGGKFQPGGKARSDAWHRQ